MNLRNQIAVRVTQLIKSYKPDSPNAVDGISFEIESGTVFGLLGPNGAGKTTTIKMILGLVLPTRGDVQLAGFDVAKDRNNALRHAGAILEGSRNVYWRLSARANLEYFGALRGMRGTSLADRITQILDIVQLSDRSKEEVRYLSRGMQQKVALATAILHEPDVLLLDEPTLGLDVQASRTIEQVIRQFVEEQGRAVLLTTHQMDLAERLSDRIFVINKGKKVEEGETGDVIARFGGQRETMEIQLAGKADQNILEPILKNFAGLSAASEGDKTVLTWTDTGSQREFLDLLNMIDESNLTILHAGRRPATLEEVFLNLTSEKNELSK
jgi:ABC-2 type transport system ATP-binding protein